MDISVEYIDIQRFEGIKKELNELYARKSSVLLEELPLELKSSATIFITGKTMSIHNGKPSMHYSDFKQFLDFLWRK